MKKVLFSSCAIMSMLAPSCLNSMSQELTYHVLDPLQDGLSSLRLLEASGSDLGIVNAARVSYNRESKVFSEADGKILETLITHGHETPFEQTFLQFHVKLPIFVARQWMRHRIGVSYNEQSARYTQMKDEFYIPMKWRTTSKDGLAAQPEKAQELKEIYRHALEVSAQTYKQLLDAGISRELARGVLPVSLYTQFVFSCNMRSLFHFVSLRADSHAQWEIQQYAKGMIQLARTHFPRSIDTWCRIKKLTFLNQEQAPAQSTVTQEKSPEVK
jgi:thymidylate synthase (FAD)